MLVAQSVCSLFTPRRDKRCVEARETSDPPPLCPHCAGATTRWGRSAAGHRRRCCRDCNRTHVERPPALKRMHRPDVLQWLLRDMLSRSPSSVRAFAARYGLHRTSVWRWRLHLLKHTMPRHLEQSELDGLVVRESRKGSREWVRHERNPGRWPCPPRPRWSDRPKLHTESNWLVWIMMDRDGGSIRLAAGRSAQRSLMRPNAIRFRSLICGASDTLRMFLAPFCGPATRYLHLYAAWHALRDGKRILPTSLYQHDLWTPSIRRRQRPNIKPRVEVPTPAEIVSTQHERRESPYIP